MLVRAGHNANGTKDTDETLTRKPPTAVEEIQGKLFKRAATMERHRKEGNRRREDIQAGSSPESSPTKMARDGNIETCSIHI